MFRIASFFRNKKEQFSISKKGVILCLIPSLLQTCALFFGVFLHGFGKPIVIEQRAQLYTTANKVQQTYSLICPKSDYSLSYLDYHISNVQNSSTLKKAGCRIFYTNDVTEEKSPFCGMLNTGGIKSPIVFCGSRQYSAASYFEVKPIIGEFTFRSETDIFVSSTLAEEYKNLLELADLDSLIGTIVFNSADEISYTIVGVFDYTNSFLNAYYDGNLVIGHFQSFSKININPKIGFLTCDHYLENLNFLYKLTNYIDGPNYGRTTLVSKQGNDFSNGGDKTLTNLIYNTNPPTLNSTVVVLSHVFSIGSIVTAFCSSYFFIGGKKYSRIISGLSFLIIVVTFLISNLINYKILVSCTPFLNMSSAMFAFIYSSLLVLICGFLDVHEKNKSKLNSSIWDMKSIDI